MPEELSDEDYRRLLQFRLDLRRFLHWSEEMAEKAGVTPAQHQLLLTIRGHKGAGGEGPTISDVAAYLLLRHHSAVGLVDRAVKAGLIERREDPVDRRMVRLSLSALGSQTLKQLSELHLEEIKRLAPRIQVISQGLEP
jgi:DNA-binding MarR family transcriptional regulator